MHTGSWDLRRVPSRSSSTACAVTTAPSSNAASPCDIWARRSPPSAPVIPVLAIAFLLVAGLLLWFVIGSRGAWWLKLPVVVYVIALAGMAAQAASVWRGDPDSKTRVAAIGGAFFVASDALLALDRFSAPIPLASTFVLATYWIAQWCIARSVRVTGRGFRPATPVADPTGPAIPP